MIAWLLPAALWGLALVSVPLLIHLLRARHAPTVHFPSVQFVRPSPVSSVRMGRPSDVLLLALRMGIVAAVALAMAQPLFVSTARLNAWNARVSRAFVIDTSDSVRRAGGDRQAADLVDAETAVSAAHFRIETPDVRSGLLRAVRWLHTAPPARREVVVVSDFQHGSVTEDDVRAVPADIGLRFVGVGELPREQRMVDVPLLTPPGSDSRTQQTQISERGTWVTFTTSPPTDQPGLRLIGSRNATDAVRVLRAVARAGAPAPRADRPLIVRFAPASAAEPVSPVRELWMIQALLHLEQDSEVNRIAKELKGPAVPDAQNWTVLIEDSSGQSLVRAAATGRELVLDVAAPITSYFAAAVVRAALSSVNGAPGDPEQEVLRIPATALSAWNRVPAPVGNDAWQHADSSDARWFWVLALALIGLEGWRRSRRSAAREEVRAAA